MRTFFLAIPLLLLNSGLSASGGVLEINQACALNGGCFAGDTEGYPVTINGSAGRSYRLTGDLDLNVAPDTTAIEIDAPHIALDLNGFEIAGPITCTGSGPTLNCGVVGNGDGINLSSNADFLTVRNGTIRNMSRHGIGASGDQLRLEGVTARHNARDGLNGGLDSIAINCIVSENGNDGFQFGSGSVIEHSVAFGNGTDGIRIEAAYGVVDHSTARNNGESGFELGHSSRFGNNVSTGNQLVNSCGGGLCTTRKRFYVTDELYMGAEAPTACTDGFHFASTWELGQFSTMAYDTVLGVNVADSGSGPPRRLGWARTGNQSGVNCLGWTSNSMANTGNANILVDSASINSAATELSPWLYQPTSCNSTVSVWCVENDQ